MPTLAQQSQALISLYVELYKEKYNVAPAINRYRERWGFQSMIEDLGYEQAKGLIKYYFNTPRIKHPVKYLLMNYDRLAVIKSDLEADEKLRAELRERTAERVREWKEQIGN